jgi:hypothetical protein
MHRWFRIHVGAVAIEAVVSQKTRTTPSKVIKVGRERLRRYDEVVKEQRMAMKRSEGGRPEQGVHSCRVHGGSPRNENATTERS